ncbi:polyprenyl synthetase family protein [Nigerium massiliense]|uniref:polyprenyl synthetase family protein n=1 Tax=Nigerium massiliense TaxID=1522317 RepID=UPI00138E39BD|nr:polyprenyl synthetase family protein [Nigerium massiliense]
MSVGALGERTPSTEVADTLAWVDARIARVLDDMAASWAEVGGDHSVALGGLDLPGLVAGATRHGKRLRPQLAHWGWVAGGAPPSAYGQVVELGTALELLHVFALVHDDVMDRSERRRGAPSVHALVRDAHRAAGCHGDAARFGDNVAVLAGDLVHAEADHLVSALPVPVRAAWRTMMIELVLGQRCDLTGAAERRRDLAHARQVARLKSGSYTVQRPLQMGALLADANPDLVGCLLIYGAHAGEAFGLRDDLLGTWGDPAFTGKSSDDDLAARKPTVLLALAAHRLDDETRSLLERGDEPLDGVQVARLRRAMEACGVRDEVERLVAGEVDAARAALVPELVGADALAGLNGLVDIMAWRNA